MIRFNDEGISVLTGAVNEKLPDVVDRLKALRDASKSYDSYSGISDDMDGSVRFIYMFDDITE